MRSAQESVASVMSPPTNVFLLSVSGIITAPLDKLALTRNVILLNPCRVRVAGDAGGKQIMRNVPPNLQSNVKLSLDTAATPPLVLELFLTTYVLEV